MPVPIKRRLLNVADAFGDVQPRHITHLLTSAAARIEELEAALAPFANAASLVATAAPSKMIIKFGFTAETYRRAADALREVAD
jgi:hypothetical protein